MQEIILFIMCYIFVLLIYEFFLVGPAKKNKKELLEVKFLITKYHLDIDKINYNQLLQLCAITSSLDIAISVNLILLVDGLIFELLVGFVAIIILIFISYYLIYLFYKKKGMIKDGKYK